MCALTQRLLDNFPTFRAILAGVVGWDSDCHHSKHLAEILQPTAEVRPCSIRDRLGQLAICDHISHLQILISNQVVRLDYAPCQLHGKVFTLPTYFEVRSSKAVSRLGSILGAFFSVRKFALKPFQGFFRLPKMTGIVESFPIRIGIEVGQPNVKTNIVRSWLSLLNPFNIKD
jgi:hypothetical protein